MARLRIAELSSSSLVHTEIDYKKLEACRLHKKTYDNKGEVYKVEYYQNFDGATYGNIVIRVDIVYSRNVEGKANYRTTTRTWFKTDNTPHEITKTTVKYYSPQEQHKELQRRRKNNIDRVTWMLASYIGEDLTYEFFDYHQADTLSYYNTFKDFIIQAIDEDLIHSWLDNEQSNGISYREWLIKELGI